MQAQLTNIPSWAYVLGFVGGVWGMTILGIPEHFLFLLLLLILLGIMTVRLPEIRSLIREVLE